MPRGLFDFRNAAMSQASSARGSGAGISSAGIVPYGNLANTTNAFMTQQAQQPYITNLPGYLGMIGQSSTNTGSMLRGEVPEDVTRMIGERAAERGVATGSPGSMNSNAAYLRALGLTSLGLQQQGEANLTGAIERTPVPQIFNPASLFVPEYLANMELNAAQSGGYSRPGGVSVVGGAPAGRTASVQQPVNYGPQPQAVGSSWATGYNMADGGYMTDAQIQKIANGDLEDDWWSTYGVNPQKQVNDQNSGTWYNAATDTSDYDESGNMSKYFN